MMLLAMAVALGLSAGLRRTITRPVEELAAVADGIVTRRDPSLRAPDTATGGVLGGDEGLQQRARRGRRTHPVKCRNPIVRFDEASGFTPGNRRIHQLRRMGLRCQRPQYLRQ